MTRLAVAGFTIEISQDPRVEWQLLDVHQGVGQRGQALLHIALEGHPVSS